MSDNLVEKYCEWVNTKSYDQLTVTDFVGAFSIDRMMTSDHLDEFFIHEITTEVSDLFSCIHHHMSNTRKISDDGYDCIKMETSVSQAFSAEPTLTPYRETLGQSIKNIFEV